MNNMVARFAVILPSLIMAGQAVVDSRFRNFDDQIKDIYSTMGNLRAFANPVREQCNVFNSHGGIQHPHLPDVPLERTIKMQRDMQCWASDMWEVMDEFYSGMMSIWNVDPQEWEQAINEELEQILEFNEEEHRRKTSQFDRGVGK